MTDNVQQPVTSGSPSEQRIGRTWRESTPAWPTRPNSTGKPNVVVVVLDDMGFSSLGCYGSEISTPVMDGLAADGIQFTNFHATALCSPTRASLLTGRNHHAVGMAFLSHVDDGFPGYRGRITPHAATLAEMLCAESYNTFAVGKWHLAPMDETSAAGPYDQWPLGRGFERYYGFMEGLTDQHFPELFSDNHAVRPTKPFDSDYHLSADLVDRSIEFVRDQTSMTPEKPFLLYLAFGATHTPFQAPAELVEKYRGRYDSGWDAIRQDRYERQLAMGVIPAGTALAPRNDDVPAWDSLSPEAQELYPKFQEVYAAFLEHTDRELGRLFDYLKRIGRYDDSVVILLSDNGASQEGGPHGVLDTTSYENGRWPTLEDNVARMAEVDGRSSHINYPLGWAQVGNTPLKRYKQNTHAGGVRTSLIMRLPGEAPRGVRRERFHHVTDVVPTVLDILEVEAPSRLRGLDQLPLDGVSMMETIRDPRQEPPARSQYFEMLGHRAIWKDGWKAVAYHQRGSDFEHDEWELYNLDADFSECHDLAVDQPEKLAELIEDWWSEARSNLVLPLDDRGFAERAMVKVRPDSPRARSVFVFHNGVHHIGTGVAPPVAGHPFEVRATIDRTSQESVGVLLAHGSISSGYSVLVDEGDLVFDLNHYGQHHLVRSTRQLPLGVIDVAARFEPDETGTGGTVSLWQDGTCIGRGHLAETFEHFIAFQGLDIGADRLSPVRAPGLGASGEGVFGGGLDTVVLELLDGPPGRGHGQLD